LYYNVRARLKRLNKQAQERANNTVSPQVRAEVEAMVDEYRTRYNSGTEIQPTEHEKAKNIFTLLKKATERR
jgi:hypothetical protein